MLEIVNITKNFADINSKGKSKDVVSPSQPLALADVSLTIKEGEFFSLLGPSGCGKTTLLRIISGLESQTSGRLIFEGKNIDSVIPQERPFNMVFQRYALFPHLTVSENLKFGLEIKKIGQPEIKKRIDDTLQLTALTHFADRFPETLSGGQAQRVALARALVNRPRILLLDEPLSALDLKLREQLQRELVTLQKQLGLTFIHVTHDQDEALTLSNRIAVMSAGKIEQVGTPQELYNHPRTQFAAEFVGHMVQAAGVCIGINESQLTIKLNNGAVFKMQKKTSNITLNQRVIVYIRPEKIELDSKKFQNEENTLDGKIDLQIFRGSFFETHLQVNDLGRIGVIGQKVLAPNFTVGTTAYMKWPSEHVHCFGIN